MNLSNIKRQARIEANELSYKQAWKIIYQYGLGSSSKAILARKLGETNHHCEHPYDFGDLMRCIGVVRAYRIDINIMKDCSYIWNRIIKQWDVLVSHAINGDRVIVNQLLDEILETPKTSQEIVDESNFIISINRVQCETAQKLNIKRVTRQKDE